MTAPITDRAAKLCAEINGLHAGPTVETCDRCALIAAAMAGERAELEQTIARQKEQIDRRDAVLTAIETALAGEPVEPEMTANDIVSTAVSTFLWGCDAEAQRRPLREAVARILRIVRPHGNGVTSWDAGRIEEIASGALCDDCENGWELMPPEFRRHEVPGSDGAVRMCVAVEAIEALDAADAEDPQKLRRATEAEQIVREVRRGETVVRVCRREDILDAVERAR